MEAASEILQPHIIMLPSPGMGHLIPFIELAKRLVLNHGFSVTFTIPAETKTGSLSKAQESVLNSLPSSINSIVLPPLDLSDILSADVKPETIVSVMVNRSLPSLSDSFKLITSTHRVVAFVVDLFGADAFDVAMEFNVKPYIFFPSTAMLLSLFFQLPKLDQDYDCEYRDVPEPIQLPGCVPINGIDLLEPLQDKKNEAYTWVLHHAKRYKSAAGVLVNTFEGLETGTIKALKEKESGNPPIYPVGPLIRTGPNDNVSDESGSLKWLDDQPLGSVLFVSFGSIGTLSSEQLTELALGLEMSEQRFLLVARIPSDDGIVFNSQGTADPFDFLPEGFLERTKNLGLVVPSWAPQVQVLGHKSTGGFLTHCGWNSTLESVVHGVPLIAWPLFAEQKMNAVMLEDLKVALRPKADERGIIGRNEISKVIRGLMEGEEGMIIKSRMSELQTAATNALEVNGFSAKSVNELASMWKN
ncbi:hydroquinone glucosyltransferase-like [Papaver somniferum]|uniref:hydroquinone glucosyltransferase-like n=1 Tax=Papaver somniferum TaxID=3469 RepID=UPI000E702062|nr:hydroquinone glucosyltransferase-like [Papaver somniferum]